MSPNKIIDPPGVGKDPVIRYAPEILKAVRVLGLIGIKVDHTMILTDTTRETTSDIIGRGMWVFLALSADDIKEFQSNARENYKPFTSINGVWHPVYQAECLRINIENSYFKVEEELVPGGDPENEQTDK